MGGYFLTLLIVGVLFYSLNYYTPIAGDDYVYMHSQYTGEKISSIKDIFLSQYSSYYIWNSRVVVHFFAQFFLWKGKECFNFVNTIVYLIFGILIFYHGTNGRFRNNLSLLLFVYCSLFMFTPTFGKSFLWLVGSCNYLFGITLALAYLIPYRFITNREIIAKKANWILELLKLMGMSILGVLAGWTNENTSVALIAIVLGFLLYYRNQNRNISPWMVGGWIGNIVGCVLHLVSPGELYRLSVEDNKVNPTSIIINTGYISIYFAEHFFVLIIVLAITGVFFVESKRGEKISEKLIRKEFDHFFISFIYLIGFLGSMYSMIVVPKTMPETMWSITHAFLLITVLSFSIGVFSRQEISEKHDLKFLRKIRTTMLLCCVVSCLCIYAKVYIVLREQAIQNNKRIEMIQECIKNNQDVAYIPTILHGAGIPRYSIITRGEDIISRNPEEWRNRAMAKYYGISKIILLDEVFR